MAKKLSNVRCSSRESFDVNGKDVDDEFLKAMGIKNPELARKFDAIAASAFEESEPEIITSSSLTVRTFFELLAMEFSTDDFLLDNGYLAKGEALTIVDPPAVRKTRFHMQLLIALLTGPGFSRLEDEWQRNTMVDFAD